MLSLQIPNLRTVLCLGAHADDIEIGCGGTMLRLLAENPGLTVHWVVLGATEQRAQEAQSSAEEFLRSAGDRQVSMHAFRDSYFPAQWGEIKTVFQQLSCSVQPDLIFTHRLDDRHQDHRLLADFTWNAFRNHLILEYEIPKYEGDLGHPGLYVPLEEPTCQAKIEITLRAFVTQQSKPWFTSDTFWSLLRLRGLECHSPSGFAEAFTVRKMVW